MQPTIEVLDRELSVCKLSTADGHLAELPFYFLSRTDNEVSLVCDTDRVPGDSVDRVDGWSAFRISGTLDFSLVGILSGITTALADAGIGLFAVSTYDTDYVLVKRDDLERAIEALSSEGYGITSSAHLSGA